MQRYAEIRAIHAQAFGKAIKINTTAESSFQGGEDLQAIGVCERRPGLVLLDTCQSLLGKTSAARNLLLAGGP